MWLNDWMNWKGQSLDVKIYSWSSVERKKNNKRNFQPVIENHENKDETKKLKIEK